MATSGEVSTLRGKLRARSSASADDPLTGIATAISFAATAIHNTRTLRHARALLNRGTAVMTI